MPDSLFFNGRQYFTPGAMSAVVDDAEQPSSVASGNNLVVVGLADGGAPGTLLTFSTPSSALATLLSGDLATAASRIFSPSDETGAPGKVSFMRVGQPTPATVMLQDAAGNNSILLTSTQYGVKANLTKVRLLPGTVQGLMASTAFGTGTVTQQDNVGRAAFVVSYAGTQLSASVTVTNQQILLQAPSGVTVATIDLNTYETCAAAADAINAVAGFSATVSPGSEQKTALNGLDTVGGADVRTAPYTVRADVQALVDWFNGNSQGAVTATRVAGAGALPANTSGWTYLTGGTYPAPLVSDWTAALAALQAEDVQWIAALTPNPAIWAAVDAHVQLMSIAGKRERRAFVGPDVGTSKASAKAAALVLNSDRTSLVWPGKYDYDLNGNYVLMAPYQVAAQVASGFAALSPGQTMTRKTLAVAGIEVPIADPLDTDDLIQAGVLTWQGTPQGFRVVRGISSWAADNKFDKVEVSCGAATDFTVKAVRAAADAQVVGQGVSPQTVALALAAAATALDGCAVPAPVGPGALVGDANSPPWRNLVGKASGDVIQLTFDCSPVVPANFVPIVATIAPYSGTVSLSAPTAASAALS